MKCNRDCFNCPYEDCILDSVSPEVSEKRKQRKVEYTRNRRNEARSNGMCVRCINKVATNGVFCLECYEKTRAYRKKQNPVSLRAMWKEKGLCSYCGEKVLDGHKLCEKHYLIAKESMKNCNSHKQIKKSS